MATPPHDPGFLKEVAHSLSKIVEPFMRPINVVSQAISDRLEHWLSRKPKLYIRLRPQTAMWCLAFQGEETGMELSFLADFTHDDPDRTLILIEAYIKESRGTTLQSRLTFRRSRWLRQTSHSVCSCIRS
jgi:hypothetical protein